MALPRVLLGCQLALALIGIGVWQDTGALKPVPPSGQPPVLADAQLPATVESASALAMNRAKRWNARARLFSVGEQIDWPLNPSPDSPTVVPAGGWLTYVFFAPWHRARSDARAASLSITIERTRGLIVREETSEWIFTPGRLAVTIGAYRIDSNAAVLAAEVAAGRAFREACPEVRHQTRLSLDLGPGGAPVWTVAYEDDQTPGEVALAVPINADTGQIGDVANRAGSCAR